MNLKLSAKLLFMLFLLASSIPCYAQDWGALRREELFEPPYEQPTELLKGQPLRKQLFDRLRPLAMKKANKEVRFSGSLKVYKNWALFIGTTLDKQGNAIGYPPMGNSDATALWLRTQSGWVVVDFSLGHSDVFWAIWHEQYGAPSALLGL